MTVDASAGLSRDLLALGKRLIVEHVRVTAFFPEIFRKRVSRPHCFQPRILFEPRLGHDRTRIGLRGRARFGFAAAIARAHLIGCLQVIVVLEGKVFAPDTGVDRIVGELDNSEEWIACLLLALKNIYQQRQSENGGEHDYCHEAHKSERSPFTIRLFLFSHSLWSPSKLLAEAINFFAPEEQSSINACDQPSCDSEYN